MKTALMPKNPSEPETCEFQTLEGNMGVLQIIGTNDNPRGVKIRYKLVHNGRQTSAVTPATNASPELRAAKVELEDLRKKYTDKHPKVQATLEKIKRLEGR